MTGTASTLRDKETPTMFNLRYVTAHMGLAIVALLVGYYLCKRFPGLFGSLPVLGNG